MTTNSLNKTLVSDRILKSLQTNWHLIFLDLLLVVIFMLLALTEAKIILFHLVFVILTIGAFFWEFRSFVWRAGLWVTATSAILFVTVLAGALPADELVEIPALVTMMVLVFVIARHRAKAELSQRLSLQETRQHQAEIAVLFESSRAVLAYHKFDNVARFIFDSCKDLIGATTGYLTLVSEDFTQSKILFGDGGRANQTTGPAMEELMREISSAGRTMYQNDVPGSKWATLVPAEHATISNVLFAPLFINEIMVGLLEFANKPDNFTENDAQLASAFSELATIALFNSQTLESLRNSEERFRSVAQTTMEAIITIDSGGNIVFWNNAASTMFGYTHAEVAGKPLTCIIPHRLRPTYQKGLERFIITRKSHLFGKRVELVGLRRDGREFPLELSLSTWETSKGVFFSGVIRDITERKQAEAAAELHRAMLRQANEELEQRVLERTAELTRINAELENEITLRRHTAEILQEREELYRTLVETAFEAVAIHSQGVFVRANMPLAKLLGATELAEVIGRPVREFIHPDYWELVQERLKRIAEKGTGVPLVEEKLIRLDGSSVDVEVASVPIMYEGRPAVQTVIHDISRRKQAESAREMERARFARDLHDSLGHSLAYLHLKLDELSSANGLGDTVVQNDLAQMRGVAHQAYEVVRDILAASLPSNSTDFASALLVQARAVGKRANFQVHLSSQGQPQPLSALVQQQLLYLLQEALVNVEKHAHAQQVEISLSWIEDALIVRLSDDGRGFPVGEPELKGHFGLTIMQSRAQEINGQLRLTSEPHLGAELEIRVPLSSPGPVENSQREIER